MGTRRKSEAERDEEGEERSGFRVKKSYRKEGRKKGVRRDVGKEFLQTEKLMRL